MWYWHEGMGWWMIFGGIWLVLFLGGLIALIAWAIKKATGPGEGTRRTNPLDIARERYAKGEITRDEFEQIRKDLQ